MSFTIFMNKKNTFLGDKNKKLKKSKNCHYSKGVNPWFLYKKWPFFQLCFARQYRPGKRLCFRYSRTKNARLGYKKRSSKSRKIAIFPKRLTHGFGPKMTIFPTSFFLGKIDQENVFDHILERKNAFLSSKNQKFKKSKN